MKRQVQEDDLVPLFKVPRHARIYSPDLEMDLNFHRIDGMYSFCTAEDASIVHLSAFAHVQIIEKEIAHEE